MTSITATPNGTSLDVSWAAITGVSQYDLFLSQSPNVSPSNYSSEYTSATTNLTITGLTAGTTYYLVVVPTALGGLAMGPASSVVAVDITGTSSTPAPVITALSASPSVASVGAPVLIACSASDSSGALLSYTWTLNGAAPSPAPSSGNAQWDWIATSAAPGTGAAPPYSVSVTVTVSNGTTSVSTTATFTVE